VPGRVFRRKPDDAPEESYSVSALAGCQVYTETSECLGELKDVLPAGGNDVFVVQGARREYLIPALKTVVQKIDLDARRIDVVMPAGLREIYEI
jgi:16S rRNA processing protein RimM